MKKLILVALAATFLSAPALAAAGETIHVGVLGLVCEFCAQSIKKVFMETGKVEAVEVNLDDALVTITTKPDASLDDKAVTDIINEAGYAVKDIHHMKGTAHD